MKKTARYLPIIFLFLSTTPCFSAQPLKNDNDSSTTQNPPVVTLDSGMQGNNEQHYAIYKMYEEEKFDLPHEVKGAKLGATQIKQKEELMNTLHRLKHIYGPENIETIDHLRKVATFFGQVGNYAESKTYFVLALENCRKICGNTHVMTALILRDFGYMLNDLGDLKSAKKHLEESLKINVENNLEDKDTANIRTIFGGVCCKLEDYDEAENQLTKALKFLQRRFGYLAYQTACTVSGLCILYDAKGDYSETKKYSELLLKVEEAYFGVDHPETVMSLVNLGILLSGAGEIKDSNFYFQKAVAIQEKNYGFAHPKTAMTRATVGSAAFERGDLKLAEKELEFALIVTKKHYRNNLIRTVTMRRKLAKIYTLLQKYKKAKFCYEDNIIILSKKLGDNHIATKEEKKLLVELESLIASKSDQAVPKSAWLTENLFDLD